MANSIVQGEKHSVWFRYGIALFAVMLAGALRAALHYGGFPVRAQEALLYFPFCPAVIFVAFYAGRGPGVLAVGLSALAAFWIGQDGQRALFSAADMITILMFVGVNLLIVWICERRQRAPRGLTEIKASQQRAEVTIAGQAEALRNAQLRLSFALDAGRVGVWDLDTLTHSAQHDTIIGYEAPLSKWTYETFLDNVFEEDRSGVMEHIRRAVETGEDLSFECRIRSPEEQVRWIWVHGKHAEGRPRLLGLVEDITDRKQIETALHESELRYRTIFETVVDAIITIDEHGIIASANPASEKLFGYRAEEMIGRNITMLMPSPFQEHHDEYLENYLRTGIKKIIGIGREVVALRKDGSTFPIHLAVSEMHIGGQRMFTGQVHDITMNKRAEDLLKEAIQDAEAANRAKDRFLAILSHELRTPLTPALMALGAHEADVTLPGELREDLGMIRRNLELEARLIDDLLDLNRVARGKVELRLHARDLHRILGNVVEICRGEIEAKSLTVRSDLAATEHNVNGDAGRLQQVFWNLLRNAIKFTPPGGIITFRSSNPHHGVIRVEVADTGRGIPPQIIAILFVAFEQGGDAITQQFGGMGLGLAISKAVVDLHGGKIWGASEGTGKGSMFSVELPLTQTEVSTEEGTRAAAFVTDWTSKIGDRKLRILLVEDNVDTLQTLRRLLERNGCSVTAAESLGAAVAAAQAAREGTEKFDLLVSDLALPDGDGRELMRQLRDRYALCGIAISGYGMEEDIIKSLDAGFAKHLTKPIQFEELQAAISDVVDHLPSRASEE